jgi:hypothetical protein
MPPAHTPQIALTRKMIAIAMHALPGSTGMPTFSAKKSRLMRIYYTRA